MALSLASLHMSFRDTHVPNEAQMIVLNTDATSSAMEERTLA